MNRAVTFCDVCDTPIDLHEALHSGGALVDHMGGNYQKFHKMHICKTCCQRIWAAKEIGLVQILEFEALADEWFTKNGGRYCDRVVALSEKK